jgi:tetratricopeptide (TPR) repeat protein
MKRRIYGGDHAAVASSLNNIVLTYLSLELYEEAKSNATSALEMFKKALPENHPYISISKRNLIFASIGLANKLLLGGKIQEALSLYASLGIDPQNLGNRIYQSAIQLWQAGELELSIDCYRVLSEKLIPQYRGVKQNLACEYHVKALKEQGFGHEEKFTEYIQKTRETFELAISVKSEEPVSAGLYAEYAQFLLKHHNTENKEEYAKIKNLLERAIANAEVPSGISYGKIDKQTTIEPLGSIIEKKGEVSINNPSIFAQYMLVKLYLMYGDIVEAKEALELLQAQVISLEETDENLVYRKMLEVAEKDMGDLCEAKKDSSFVTMVLSPRQAGGGNSVSK